MDKSHSPTRSQDCSLSTYGNFVKCHYDLFCIPPCSTRLTLDCYDFKDLVPYYLYNTQFAQETTAQGFFQGLDLLFSVFVQMEVQ